MLRHLFKLIWKRKSRHLMLSLEILLAFVIVFAIAAFGLRNYQLYRLPTGFDYRPLWSVAIQTPRDDGIGNDPALYDALRRKLLALPEVEQVAFVNFTPYESSTISTRVKLPGDGNTARSHTELLDVSDDYFATAGVPLAAGRWFSAQDEGGAAVPVVVNRRLAEQLFPGRSPLGLEFTDAEAGDKEQRRLRVVGMVDEYRHQGEYMAPTGMMFERFSPLSSKKGLQTILLKLRPGTPRDFAATLNRQLKLVRNDWSYSIAPLAELRGAFLRLQLTPLLVLAVVAAFLLLMVAFGLFGVLWQNTTRRIPEIGLRRAVGADAGHIYRQIIGEQLLTSSLAMAAGLLLLVQLPLTGALGESLDWPLFAAAAALAMLVIYLLSLLCSLYPGWRAARLSPTQALHYE